MPEVVGQLVREISKGLALKGRTTVQRESPIRLLRRATPKGRSEPHSFAGRQPAPPLRSPAKALGCEGVAQQGVILTLTISERRAKPTGSGHHHRNDTGRPREHSAFTTGDDRRETNRSLHSSAYESHHGYEPTTKNILRTFKSTPPA